MDQSLKVSSLLLETPTTIITSPRYVPVYESAKTCKLASLIELCSAKCDIHTLVLWFQTRTLQSVTLSGGCLAWQTKGVTQMDPSFTLHFNQQRGWTPNTSRSG